jgi:hypothetical protein
MPPDDAFSVPRDPHAVRIELTRTWLLFVIDVFLVVFSGVPLIQTAAALVGAYYLVMSLWETSHRKDGSILAFETGGIRHRDLGLIPWDRVQQVRARRRALVISVRDLVGLARANGVRLGVLDLVVFGLFRRPLVVSAATVRPLGLDRIQAELDRARGTTP